MLPAHLVADNGLRIIENHPEIITNIRRSVADLDVSASYPNGECVANISKETTLREIISIEGVDNYTQRMLGMNITAGATNAVEVCCGLMNMPPLAVMLDAFQKHLGQAVEEHHGDLYENARFISSEFSDEEDEDEGEEEGEEA